MKKRVTPRRPRAPNSAKGSKRSSPGSGKASKKKSVARRLSGHWLSVPELAGLLDKLREAQETLEAIRSGAVDAVVVSGANGAQVYSLAGAEQPYRVYVEQMQEGAVTVSPDGLILYCNQRFSEMVRLPLEQVISSGIQRFLTPEAWLEIGGVFGPVEGVVKHENNLQRADHLPLPVHLTASRLPLEGQDVMCLVVTDLSAQKERAQLQLAKEVAEKASLAKDSFLAALSHELRTPLTPALMVASMLENDQTLSVDTRRQLSTIRRNVELEARLIDDLLDLTRIARGKLEFHPGLMDVHHSLRNAIEICLPEIEAKTQTISVFLEAQHTQTMGDAVRIQQVMWNLIRNAAKFTPVRGQINVRTGNTDEAIWVEITDTGIGFEAGAERRLFQAFEQGGRHVTQQFGGLGLGLAISRSIVAAHEGNIRASSPGPGKGATFTLGLPVRKFIPLVTPTTTPTVTAPLSGQLRILLVEDHKDTRANLEALLRAYEHQVRTASSAEEALRLAESSKFDLVISDLGLPDQSGLVMMKSLRDRFGLRGIAVSGYGMEEDIAESRDAGFVHHLTKPIAFDRLKRLIAETAWTLA